MRQANAGQPGLLCGQGLMVFQLAGQVQVAAGGDDGVEDLAARAGTDGGLADGAFGRADEADGAGAGCGFYGFYNGVK